MILNEFPNLDWLKKQAEEGFVNRKSWSGNALTSRGWPNVIINTSTRKALRDNIRGPLSIFTNLRGESTLEAGNRRVTIKEDFFYVTNHDQYYTLEINQPLPVETFNIHFGEYFSDQVLGSLSQTGDGLLENFFENPGMRMEFHNKLYHRDPSIQQLIYEIKNQTSPTSCWLEEKLYELMANLLRKENSLLRIQASLPATKTSTRKEILKRLILVTDYIHEHLHEDLSLEQLAVVACLSKFHFLRLFKIAFDKTPAQFVNELRLRKGEQLIKNTRLEIHEIAAQLGFSNPSSFSRLFFQHAGVYPTHFRRAVA